MHDDQWQPNLDRLLGDHGCQGWDAGAGPGIPAGATIASNITATGFTLSANATADGNPLVTIRHQPWTTDDGGQPSILRFPGRVFIGNAIGQPDGRFAHPYWNFCPEPADCSNWAARDSDLVVMSTRGAQAITGMTRTSDGADLTNPPSPIGISGFLITDAANRGGHASYFDVEHEAAADGRFAFGNETALKNQAGNYTSTAYDNQPGVYGIRLSGGGDAASGGPAINPANTALHIATIMGGGPPYTFNKGIVFMHNSLTGTDGFTGCCGAAIEMARGHMVRWQTQTGLGFGIRSEVNDPTGQIQILADDNNLSVFGNTGTSNIMELVNVPAAVSHLQVRNSIAGTAPTLEAHSATDANVGMTLKTQGTGTVNVGQGLKLPNYTVATLPACNAGYTYVVAAVSDASAPAYNATLTGGGATRVPVMCDGALWRAH